MTDITVATFSLTEGDNGSQVSIIFSDGSSETISDKHQNFDSIVAALISKPEGYGQVVFDLANIPKTIGRKFRNLSNRVTTDGSEIYFDGDAIDDSLSQFILKLLREDAHKAAAFFEGGSSVDSENEDATTWEALVKFLELLYSNPNDQSRNSLYEWISRYGLTIRKDGHFIAYKGVNSDFGSRHSGYGIVDGVEVNGVLFNKPGSVLRFPRKDVNSNTGVGCAQGLHAGTHSYATDWARDGKLVSVAINPMNVVSVPDDCTYQKLRVCEYEVLSEVDPLEEALATSGWNSSSSFWNSDEDDSDEEDCDESCCDRDEEDDEEEDCSEDCCDQDEASEETEGFNFEGTPTEALSALRDLIVGGVPSIDLAEILKHSQASVSSEVRSWGKTLLNHSPLDSVLDFLSDFTGAFGGEDNEEADEPEAQDRSEDLTEGDTVDFDYVSLNGSSQHVQGAEVQEVQVDHFRAYLPSKAGYRTFKFDGVSNMVDSESNDEADTQEEATTRPSSAPRASAGQTVEVTYYDRSRKPQHFIGQVLISDDHSMTVKSQAQGKYDAIKHSDVISLTIRN